MKKTLFAPFAEIQLPSHCGPCSLSACLFMLGISATQRQLAKAAGRPVSAFVHGVDEKGLRRAATAYGVKSEFLLVDDKDKGHAFAVRLRKHLRAGYTAILLVRDFEHWVAVIGYLWRQRRFVVVDPKDKKSVFLRWSESCLLRGAWNRNPQEEHLEPSQYFAILLSRRKGQSPRWRISESWLRLCERGSEDTAEGMAGDLAEIALLASGEADTIEDGPYLAEVLAQEEETILASIVHWARGSDRIGRADLRTFYRDYVTVASASGIRLAPKADRAVVVSHVTSLMSSYWWGAAF